MARTVRKLHRAERDDIADLQTRRPLPGPEIDMLDPFLFLNHHGPQVYAPANEGLPFAPHPHRGFETVTFILDGDVLHRDTGGHESVIRAGGVQWMTAGRGLIHSELSSEEFKRRGGPLEALQLWVNLPARLKMTQPRYVGLQREQIPSIRRGGGTIALISGALDGQEGPFESLTGVVMMTVSLPAGGRVRLPAPRERNVFLYVVRGELRIGSARAPAFHLVDLNDDGDDVDIEAAQDSVFLFGHAEPLREPVAAQGPFVMNTREQIFQAIRDYQSGAFGAPPG